MTMVGLSVAGCSPELNWRELRFEEAGVSQLFPCKPVRQQRTLVLAGRPHVLVLHVCDTAGATWALSHVQAVDNAEVPALLDAMAGGAHANLGAARGAVQSLAVPGASSQAAAGRYRFRGRAPDGRDLEAGMLLYARGTVVVQLTVLGPRLSSDATDTFLGAARAGS